MASSSSSMKRFKLRRTNDLCALQSSDETATKPAAKTPKKIKRTEETCSTYLKNLQQIVDYAENSVRKRRAAPKTAIARKIVKAKRHLAPTAGTVPPPTTGFSNGERNNEKVSDLVQEPVHASGEQSDQEPEGATTGDFRVKNKKKATRHQPGPVIHQSNSNLSIAKEPNDKNGQDHDLEDINLNSFQSLKKTSGRRSRKTWNITADNIFNIVQDVHHHVEGPQNRRLRRPWETSNCTIVRPPPEESQSRKSEGFGDNFVDNVMCQKKTPGKVWEFFNANDNHFNIVQEPQLDNTGPTHQSQNLGKKRRTWGKSVHLSRWSESIKVMSPSNSSCDDSTETTTPQKKPSSQGLEVTVLPSPIQISERRRTYELEESVTDLNTLKRCSMSKPNKVGWNTIISIDSSDSIIVLEDTPPSGDRSTSTPKQVTKPKSDSLLVTALSNTTSKKQLNRSKVKVPNFAAIHQKALERMEDIGQYKKRKEERAKYLLSGQKPVQSPLKHVEAKKSQKMLQFHSSKVEKSKLVPRSPLVELQDVRPQVRLRTPKRVESRFKPSIVVRKEVAREIVEKKAPPVKNRSEQQKVVIKGVRSNKRFDLLMKMRLQGKK